MKTLKHGIVWGLVLTGCTLATGAPDPSPTPLVPPPTSATDSAPSVTPISSPAPATPLPGVVASPAATAPPTPTPVQVANALPIPDSLARVEPDRLIVSVNQLANLTNRHALGSSGRTARDSLFAAFQAIQQPGMEVFLHPFTFTDQTVTGHNVVLVFRGSDPAAGAVIVGAHYDTRSGDPAAADTVQPGADDNASGVAAVLEIARLMAGRSPRATVICVLFGAEEQGRFGSQAFVRDVIQAQGITVQAMLNLDIVGSPTGPDGQPQQRMRVYSAPPDDSPSRRLARQIAQIAADHVPGLAIDVRDTLDRPGRWGDHQSFSDAGYAAARLIEAADDPQRTHNADDRPDHLDAAYLRRVTQVALATALALVES
jgi:Zn-dependent M28 family amino/carboxypeptidase